MDVDQRVTEVKESDCSPETVLTRLWNTVTSDMRFVFLSTLIMGLITHLFVFTNKFVNSDDMSFFYTNTGMPTGRWFSWLSTQVISGNYSMPWVNGFMSLVFIAISVCLIVSVFDIRSRLHMLLIGGLMMTFVTVSCTFSYIYTASVYFLSLLLAVLSVWMTRKYRWGFIPAGISLVFSLGIYQAYICMAIALFAICILKETLEDDTDNRTLLVHIGKYLACGIIGLVGYYLIFRFLLFFVQCELTSHQGFSSFSITSLISIGSILSVGKGFMRFFIIGGYGVIGMLSWFFRIATFLIFAMIFIYTVRLCVYKWKQNRNIFQAVLAFGILFMLPIWINCLYLAVGVTVHYLAIYSYVTPYILLLVLMEISNRNQVSIRCGAFALVMRWASFCCIMTVIYVGYLAANEYYLKLHLAYEQSYSLVLRVIDRLEQMDGFDLEHTPVAMVYISKQEVPDEPKDFMSDIRGKWQRVKLKISKQHGRFASIILFNPVNPFFSTVQFQLMSEYYFQKKFILPPVGDKALRENPEIRAMPCFPAKDSIREIDGVIVVKINEDQFE